MHFVSFYKSKISEYCEENVKSRNHPQKSTVRECPLSPLEHPVAVHALIEKSLGQYEHPPPVIGPGSARQGFEATVEFSVQSEELPHPVCVLRDCYLSSPDPFTGLLHCPVH